METKEFIDKLIYVIATYTNVIMVAPIFIMITLGNILEKIGAKKKYKKLIIIGKTIKITLIYIIMIGGMYFSYTVFSNR